MVKFQAILSGIDKKLLVGILIITTLLLIIFIVNIWFFISHRESGIVSPHEAIGLTVANVIGIILIFMLGGIVIVGLSKMTAHPIAAPPQQVVAKKTVAETPVTQAPVIQQTVPVIHTPTTQPPVMQIPPVSQPQIKVPISKRIFEVQQSPLAPQLQPSFSSSVQIPGERYLATISNQ
jgi:hypothetical protein